MLTEENQQKLNKSGDTKLAVDSMRVVFQSNGKIQPKHQKALDALARFCKINVYNHHGADQTEIVRLTGRREVYYFIMFCLEYSAKERRKLVAQITELEDIRDGRRTDGPDDD